MTCIPFREILLGIFAKYPVRQLLKFKNFIQGSKVPLPIARVIFGQHVSIFLEC